MKTRILIVEDTFSIQGRGLVVCGRKTEAFTDLRSGNLIELETAEKRFVQTAIRGLEMICRRPYDDKIICFLTDRNVEKSDVPKGAAIWLLNGDG